MKQHISFDLDGVLANFTRGFTRIAHRLFGTPVGDGQSQESWYFEDYPQLGLTKEHCDFKNGPIWNEVRTSPRFWANLDPLNPSVMMRIHSIKNKIFITNRLGVDPIRQSIDFLWRCGVDDPIVLLAEKKGPVVVEYNVVAHVDDYYPNCTDIKAAAPDCYVAMHYAPYNKQYHAEWIAAGNEVTLSVDHFIDECDARGLTEY